MLNEKKVKSINLDRKTIQRCDNFGIEHGLSRSAVIRLAVNEFFIKREAR